MPSGDSPEASHLAAPSIPPAEPGTPLTATTTL